MKYILFCLNNNYKTRFIHCFAIPSAGIYHIFNVWTSPEERTTLLGFVFSSIAFGTVVNYPFASLMCQLSEEGWALIFYVPGSLGLLLTIAFYFIVFNEPSQHPRIATEESKYVFTKYMSHALCLGIPNFLDLVNVLDNCQFANFCQRCV